MDMSQSTTLARRSNSVVQSLCVGLAIIDLCVASFSGATNETFHSELCIVFAKEDGDGISIFEATSNNAEPNRITHLSNYSLPTTGCQPNFAQCELSCHPCHHGLDQIGTEDEEEDGGGEGSRRQLCCVLPVVDVMGRNGLAVVQMWSESQVLRILNQTVVVHGEDCVMGHIFYRESGSHAATCINTTASTSNKSFAYIWFLYVSYDTDSGIVDFINNGNTVYTPLGNFSDSLTLSEPHHLGNTYGDCTYHDNFFGVANSMGFATSIIVSPQDQPEQEDHFSNIQLWNITDCLYPLDVGYIEAEDHLLLRVQCSRYITKFVRACGSHETVETYDSQVNGTIYQCKIPDTQVKVNVTLKDDVIWFTKSENHPLFENMTTSSYPFTHTQDIAYGYCTIGKHVSLVFGLNNGSVYSFSFTSGNISMLARNSCNGSTTNYTRGYCDKAQIVPQTSDIVAVYDYSESVFVMANLSCPGDPVVGNISVSPKPPMAGIISGSIRVCRSTEVVSDLTSSTAPPSPTSVLTNSSLRPGIASSSTIMSSQPGPRTSAGFSDVKLYVTIIVSLSFVFFILIITIIVCIYMKKRRTRATKRKHLLELQENSSIGGVSNATGPFLPKSMEKVETPRETTPGSDSPSKDNHPFKGHGLRAEDVFSSRQSLAVTTNPVDDADNDEPIPKPLPPDDSIDYSEIVPDENEGMLFESQSNEGSLEHHQLTLYQSSHFHGQALASGNPGRLETIDPQAPETPGHQPTAGVIPQAVTDDSNEFAAAVPGNFPSIQVILPAQDQGQYHQQQHQQQQAQPQNFPTLESDPSTGQQQNSGS